ncbi:MAG: zinc-ribbon domain-containing protein [Anaerolineae bacterium]|nr:zinc-ribbon domain-containing protein [Anaerolineae bacterium]
MTTNICPYCAAENRPGARHCRQCGRPLVQETPTPQPAVTTVCPVCHAPLNSGARFCPRCGAAVGAGAPAPTVPAPQPPPPTPPAFQARPVAPKPAPPPKKGFPILPVALIGGLVLLCVCAGGVIAVTQLWDKLPWVAQPTDTVVLTEAPIVTTEPPPATTEPQPTDTPTTEAVQRIERWAFRERGGASPGLLMTQPGCSTCDVRVEVFRPVLYTIELGGDRLYYWDELLETVFYVTPDGGIHEIPSPPGTMADFAVAPDASMIAWGMYDSDDDGVTARVTLTDGEGGQARVLTEQRHTHEEGARNLIPFAWSPNLSTLYVAQRYWGIGGYILFDILPQPMTLDVATGATQSLNATDCSLVALSPDGNTLAYLVEADDHQDLILRDLRTNNEQRVTGTPGHFQAGDLLFSPDSRYLAYAEALGNPESEAFSLRRVEVSSGAVETLIADERTDTFNVAGWVGNEAGGFDVVVVGSKGSERISNSGRELISEYSFVGSWIEEP